MKYFVLLSASLVASACSPPPQNKETAMMDEIERTVVLPKGAEALDKYGRTYALGAKGKILGAYIIPSPLVGMDAGCDVMLENLASRPCTKNEIEASSLLHTQNAGAQTAAGERRWIQNSNDLPFINDGGCQQVNVEYDAKVRRVLSVVCNGEA